MKHIKDYFNKHLKLKKIVKCLGVVAIVLSFLFNALIGVALLVNNVNNNNTLNESEPIHKNIPVINDNYQLYVLNSDLITKEFINSLLNYADETTGYADYISLGEMIQQGVGAEINVIPYYAGSTSQSGIFGWFINYNEYKPEYFTNYIDAGRAIKYINIYVGSMGTNIPSYDYTFKVFNCRFRLYGNDNTILSSVNFYVGAYFYSNGNIQNYFVYYHTDNLGYVLVNRYAIETTNSNIFLKLYQDSNPSYKLGYEQGYNSGVANAHTENEGVFGLIADAFRSVASIFNIVIIPGFTIGTLITIPLVVMVIIILFKMFRG